MSADNAHPKEIEAILENPRPNNKLMAEDGCFLCEMDHSDAIVKQFDTFEKFLKLGFLRFDPQAKRCSRIISNVAINLFVLLSLYISAHDLYNVLTDCKHPSFTTTLVLLVWFLQSMIANWFLAKWQKGLMFEEFFHLVKHAKLDLNVYDEQRNFSIRRNSLRFFCTFVATQILCVILFYTFYNDVEVDVFHPNFRFAFYFEELRYLRILQIQLNMLVWNVALHTYICLTNAMKWEIKKFNWQIENLKHQQNAEKLQETLLCLIRHHTDLNKCVRHLDSIFKVYAFLMIATVIPTMIFTLLMLFSQVTPFGIALSVPSVLFTSYAFYGLTMSPAALYEELDHSKSALCLNMDIWIPFEEKSNAIARTLGMHLNQSNLGISLWGFVMVTKSLILTTISIMVTCLTLLLEFAPEKKEENNIN